eukprot:1176417-Prorocentrum_minimum.AAC.3
MEQSPLKNGPKECYERTIPKCYQRWCRLQRSTRPSAFHTPAVDNTPQTKRELAIPKVLGRFN